MADKTEKFAEEIIKSWTDFYTQAQVFERKNWIFRGQSQDWCLTTRLERGLLSWGIPLTRGPVIERALVREFNRRLRGEEYLRAKDNKLYSLALMQHHGAPTRLLDCTYSPFVAAQMAIKEGEKEKDHAIWCFNSDWMDTHFKRLFGLKKAKEHDKKRTDTTFTSIYNNTKSFVHQENPLLLNERLTIQQGVFLCPGNARQPFQKNLCEMEGWNSRNNVCKLRLVLTREERAVFVKMLKRMNLNEAALFPGLDGFARSLGEHLRHFNELY
jgi:FRG domain